MGAGSPDGADRDDRAAACARLEPVVPCECRTAVVRAYHEMILRGASHEAAVDVGTRIFCYHHPGHPRQQVSQLVERLVDRSALH